MSAKSIFIMGALLIYGSLAKASGYTFTHLSNLGGTFSYASAINNGGQVAGYSAITNNVARHAVLWSGNAVIDLHMSGNGGSSSAFAINDAGQIAGASNHHATLWNGTTAIDLGTLGGTTSVAYGINNAGQVAGYSDTTGNVAQHATVWNGTTAIDLGTLGGNNSLAGSINDAGQVVGSATTYPNTIGVHSIHATVWNGTTATDLGPQGGRYGNFSSAFAINSAGQVVGDADLQAALWNGATMTKLDTLSGATTSQAFDINNAGIVVGTSWNNTDHHATLWNGTAATDLNSFLDAASVRDGWVLVQATGINDNGSIVGEAYNSKLNGNQAFLLTPDGISPNDPIMPTTYLTSGWGFDFAIPSYTIYLDPLVATGYDYILDSGPNFQSVLLPSIGDNQFGLYLWNGTTWTFDSVINAGTEHSFGSMGVDRFRIAGIETSAGLDPNSPTAFVTGLTFAGTGEASMRMIPLTQEVGVVPEPETYAMLLGGLGLLGFMVRRRKTS
ncbi:PEP-CTERM sorting domain-containing protein [Nitrosospira sp. Nsp1]|uniref:PEP-CTERM sorting domain-containing protein n=1 Tax=Nitrosospira sp. Nsp1 TaxID=136547 RepID=UPI000885ACEF|nr:PEP-CTERM sorting domain-containing protein [Nitrosospira sp. Nsp1]SCX57859.1 PEP-CTERM protein-sorting domain-containing protein [Nitrosospira sp. Nsp1]